ncbi:MAG TPA: hypothetical protein VFV66_10065 [Nonomuraea sp.]|nr:hypothetical protein [Nonomuraea sp.]
MHDTRHSAAPSTSSPAIAGRWPLAGIAFAGMFIGGLILSTVLGTRTFPSPYEPAEAITQYFTDNVSAVLGLGLLHTISALPLLIFTATLADSVRDGLPRALSQHAGLIAAVFLLISGMCSVALVSDGVTGDALRALHMLTFLSGGSVHVFYLGILVGAGTIALIGSVPRAIAVLGGISAVLSLASIVSLVVPGAAFLLPLGRFTGLAWIIATAIWLVRRRPA